jgi:radical SAM superfamily enzyme YgiQ (UPF0313 family)
MGLAYISRALKDIGCSVKCVDLLWETRDQVAIIHALRDFKPDVVSVSIRNLDNLTFLDPIYFAPQVNRIVLCCRKYSDAAVVLGGTGFSVASRDLMHYTKADYGIVGEGEVSCAQLICNLRDGCKDFSGISGLCYWKDGRLVSEAAQCAITLESKIFPDRSIYDPRYFRESITTATDLTRTLQPAFETMQSRRGCSLGCTYCIIRNTEGTTPRCKSPEVVAAEMQRICRDNPLVREIEFVDATFNFPVDYAKAVCEAMIQCGLTTPWFCQMSPKYIDKELIDLLERANCIRVELGTDAFADPVLEKLNKGFDFAQVYEVDTLFSASSIDHTHCVFFGGPGETVETISETLRIATTELHPAQVYANLGIRILEGTGLQKIAMEKGIIAEDHPMLIPTFYVESEIVDSSECLDQLRDTVLSQNNWYLWWGLSGCRIQDRIPEVRKLLSEWEEDFHITMDEPMTMVV